VLQTWALISLMPKALFSIIRRLLLQLCFHRMNTARFPSNALTTFLRWLARLMALALAGFILLMAIGEGLNLAKFKTAELALAVPFFVTWVGLSVGWRWERLGGILIVAGVAGFYLVHFAVTGFGRLPRGWVFPMLAAPGVLFLACWWLSGKTSAARTTA
jgi:hypothetical protein